VANVTCSDFVEAPTPTPPTLPPSSNAGNCILLSGGGNTAVNQQYRLVQTANLRETVFQGVDDTQVTLSYITLGAEPFSDQWTIAIGFAQSYRASQKGASSLFVPYVSVAGSIGFSPPPIVTAVECGERASR
jgi:hypothetical protein